MEPLRHEIFPGLFVEEDETIPPGIMIVKQDGQEVARVALQPEKLPSEIYDELVAWLDSEDLIPSPQEFGVIVDRAFHLDREEVWALERGQFDRAKEYRPKVDAAYKTMMRFYTKTWEATGANK